LIDLSSLNTLSVPSRAAKVHRVTHLAELEALADRARQGRLIVLGGGSNVVLGQTLEADVCLMRNRGVRAAAGPDGIEVTVQAGERWHDLVRWTLGRGLSGLENLALIPGSAGAAPVQNIGAYGVELAERFISLRALDVETGRLVRLDREDCAFGYRTSLFKASPGRFVIAELTLNLDAEPGSPNVGYPDVAKELERIGRQRARPVDVAEAVIRVRRRKLPDPRWVPNAGSFFKNPIVSRARHAELVAGEPGLKSFPDERGVKLAAAQLIERCAAPSDGIRPDWALADAPIRIWSRQPLVLTNPGHRPASEVLGVAENIRAAVAARFGVRLELEPDRFGC
jgi:UDP-N-acetylmuramate dehydrogenase